MLRIAFKILNKLIPHFSINPKPTHNFNLFILIFKYIQNIHTYVQFMSGVYTKSECHHNVNFVHKFKTECFLIHIVCTYYYTAMYNAATAQWGKPECEF